MDACPLSRILCVLIFLFCLSVSIEARGRGGGARGSSRGGGSRGSRSSFSSRTAARYSRAYVGTRGFYYHYYSLYFVYRPGVVGYRKPSSSATICRNYEANANGTVLGVFGCPLPFEPADFKYCCGQEHAEYCCKFIDNSGNLAGIIVGCILFVILIVAVVSLCIYKHRK